jgi:flagellar assembly factor FliW
VRVSSTRLGDLEIDSSTVLTFPEGLVGFGDARRFAVVDTHDSGVYYWLQSLDDPQLAFLSVTPWPFFPDYEPVVPDADREALDLSDPGDAVVFCLLTVDRDSELITANLLGPLVVNTKNRVGRQVVLDQGNHPTRAPLVSA